MQIDRAEALRRLNSSRNIADLGRIRNGESKALSTPETPAPTEEVTHVQIDHGVRRGRSNVPEILRDTMAELAVGGTANSVIAEAFGVSTDVVERASSGRVGGRPATAERAAKVSARKLEIQDTALMKLMQSLNLIDEDKLGECDARQLSQVAANLSKVSSSLDPKQEGGLGNTHVIVYAPERKEERSYKVVDV